MENRKNTVLLTVIAIATLLVAVVGATFAYFSAQVGDGARQKVEVTTHTTDSALFEFLGDLTINADQYNFGADKIGIDNPATNKNATAKATFTAGTKEDADLCYTVTLTLNNSSPMPGTGGETGVPAVEKTNTFKYPVVDNAGVNEIEKYVDKYLPDDGKYATIKAAAEAAGATEEDKLKVAELIFTAKKKQTVDGTAGPEVTIFDKYDITEQTTDLAIPISDASPSLIHIMSAQAGKTVLDEWDFNVILVNKEWDQQYNTNKNFRATIDFVKLSEAECNAAIHPGSGA